MKIELKRAVIADIDKFLGLEKLAAGTPIYSAMTDKEDAFNEISKNTVYFIEKDGETVGNISYEIKESKTAYISGLMVDPRFQGQGIGKQAMAMIIEELKDMEKIELVTHPRNTKALMMYLPLGFEIDKWIDNYFGDGDPRVSLAKKK
ncbi:MAG: GNAT family N-acetyltransferase [Candidatus Paceibacterota bacterium]|jgi:ribosomal protein S18 acetylase RimI-like enzyme